MGSIVAIGYQYSPESVFQANYSDAVDECKKLNMTLVEMECASEFEMLKTNTAVGTRNSA
jgi:hypothetical protein